MELTLRFAAFIASRHLHWILLIGILHAPISFFDTTPIGRIINRFSKEIDSVDTVLPTSFGQALITLSMFLTTIILLIYGSWFAILELIPVILLFIYNQVNLFLFLLISCFCKNRRSYLLAYIYSIITTTSSS